MFPVYRVSRFLALGLERFKTVLIAVQLLRDTVKTNYRLLLYLMSVFLPKRNTSRRHATPVDKK